jgi:hypothetical protein
VLRFVTFKTVVFRDPKYDPYTQILTHPNFMFNLQITNMRLMHKIGVRGIFLDHNGVNSRSGWSELQAFLVLKLAQDIDALIEEFTDHMYGPAAPLVRRYLDELESARKAMKTFAPQVTYKSRNFDDRTFPYLTPANIDRWQQTFGRMLKLAGGEGRCIDEAFEVLQ